MSEIIERAATFLKKNWLKKLLYTGLISVW